MVFDLLSSEYGWSTEYILTRTTREIGHRVMAISKRFKRKFDLDLALHDKKLSTEEEEENDFSHEQVKLMDDALEQAKERKLREMRKLSAK